MPAFTGADAARVGTVVKEALRDFIKPAIVASNGPFYERYGGFDCDLIDAFVTEDAEDRPKLSIHTNTIRRNRMGGRLRLDFTLELRVAADTNSGAQTDPTSNPTGADEQLSWDAENALDNLAAREALKAIGIDAVSVGDRRESFRDGKHLNITTVTCSAFVAPPAAA